MFRDVLAGFCLHLAFGLGLALLAVSPTLVRSGFFRIQLWIMMGLCVMAGLILLPDASPLERAAVFGSAFVCYVGAVGYLYERFGLGRCAATIATLAQIPLFAMMGGERATRDGWNWMGIADGVSSGALLGFTVTAMLLGHWYLNVPGMKLKPLRGLLIGILGAILIRGAFEVFQLPLVLYDHEAGRAEWSVLAMRWIAGLLGTALLTAMSWQTLRIPNTQSATGILYVAVILVFLGELSSRLLSV